ncbi:DUF7519 family protein [Halapricum hydrolyticum]|uniref:Uncharacterized protein n=1 Tax=Halapricum hydrolyticum TaxID=2979991 RepID=A0AAE3LGA0_9EURY|nr:hypothetical protein [Halapricum hydrolyticum]MCU4719408.1 hypothetical protein [Halapricum hydrolyticum]MCU4728417.1 hypothetical protein [Halapricum hydrolyticum]
MGENAIAVAEQFPRSISTPRGEALHATSATVVTGFAAVAAAAYTLSTGGYSLTAVAFLVVGSLVILVGLGR